MNDAKAVLRRHLENCFQSGLHCITYLEKSVIVVLTLGDVNLGCRHETFDPYRLVFNTGAVRAKALAVATVMGDARIRQRPRNRHLDVGGGDCRFATSRPTRTVRIDLAPTVANESDCPSGSRLQPADDLDT